jgi:hypothetical protein
MTTIDFPVPPPADDPAATPESTRAELLGAQTRRGPGIRSAFLQERGGARAPGPLRHFVRERRPFALQLYLLVHCIARRHPWDATLPAATWARALDKTNAGAEATVSRSWAWLEDQSLVRTQRRKRMVQVYLRTEDGKDQPYTRSRDFFYFPLAFFRDEWHTKLGLPATSVLLIALDKSKRSPWFQLRSEVQSAWYGISADTLQRGLDELRDAGLLVTHPRRIHDARARYGTTMVNEYLLLPPFATPNVDPAAAQTQPPR